MRTLSELENLEFRLVGVIGKLSAPQLKSTAGRQALDALEKVRRAKAAMISADDSILRKASSLLPPVRWGVGGLPCDQIAKANMIAEHRDRAAEVARLAKHAAGGARRFQAPDRLRGQQIRLADGRRVDIPSHGFVTIAGTHPALAETVHDKLRAQGFRECEMAAEPGQHPDDVSGREAMDAIKRSHACPIYGHTAVTKFLNRNAVGA